FFFFALEFTYRYINRALRSDVCTLFRLRSRVRSQKRIPVARTTLPLRSLTYALLPNCFFLCSIGGASFA
ncbi:MAG: hypothetical protein ACXADY_10505, partial [Candidatus Hodarchaeales archaeon]